MDRQTIRPGDRERWGALAALLITMAAGYFLLSDLMGGTLFQHQYWDSYTLQTWNWLQGRMYIADPEKYEYLELAIYEGRYYMSFPPLPSVLLVPFVAVCGLDTPNNLIIACYGLVAATLAYLVMLKAGRSPRVSAFWALVCVWGSNMLWMTTNAGVWFQAQALNMVMCLAAVLCFLSGRKAASTTFLALAVGCRPLSALYLAVFAFLYAWGERDAHGGFWKSCLRQWPILVGPVLIGGCYMAYNYARFGNPLEFGHNYLPEFIRAEHGQFHISYLLPNLRQMFLEPIRIKDGRLEFTLFQGFMCYVANPLLVIWVVRMIVNARRDHRVTLFGGLLVVAAAAVLLLTCMHRTLGGWQFGARYTCDVLPIAYLYLARRGTVRPANWELALGGLAVAFNAYGALYMHFYG